MNIKNVSLKDLRKIYSLERKVFKENAFSRNLIYKLIRKNTLFLKLENKKFILKNVIGFIICIKDKIDRVNIINFLIEPNNQNRGYGSYLLDYTIKRIEELKGIKEIVLNVQVSNSIAIRLYHKFGFKIIEKIDNYYQSKESAYFMSFTVNS
ncbi:MAG: GNAT family N-acetyltransferase [Candidatus Hermodarchaeota archaeon]